MSNLNEEVQEEKKDEIKWTDEQREAFEDRGHNLLVSASAGSGKTTVMIKRIVDLMLEDETPISNFLVVTFTKASAADMKKKLIDELLKKQDNPFALEQIENVETSDISNLHSFCSRLISTYFYEVGIDPAYHIVDDTEASFLKEKALEKLFETKEKYGDLNFFEIFEIFQKKRSNKQLKEIIRKFNDFLNANIDGKEWFESTLNATHDKDLNKNLAANIINKKVCAMAAVDAEKAYETAVLCKNAGQEKLYDFFMCYYEGLRTVNFNNSFMVNAKNLFDISIPRKPAVDKKKDGYEEIGALATSVSDDLGDNLDNFKSNFVSCDEKILIEGIVVSKKRLEFLFELVCEFNEIYSALKKDVNGLDFNDLEKYALKILSNDAILSAVKQKYKYVFVDEYQDVNSVQEKIVSLVSGHNNRFMVGDVKQSIYRFRLCDPDIFLQKYELYGKGGEFDKLIRLNCNFRSDKNILKFVDKVFCGAMTEEFGGVDYEKDAKFVADEKNRDEQASVNLCYINTSLDKKEKSEAKGVYSVKNHIEEYSEEVKASIAEAKYVANEIKKLTDRNGENPIAYKNIAILVGARNDAIEKFVDTLKSLDIPVAADEKRDVMEKNYVQEIVNFVKLLVNEKDDYVLFNVLKSRLFNFSEDEIVEIRKLDKNEKFHNTIMLYEKLESDALKQKIAAFIEKLKTFKIFAKIMQIKDLVYKIIEDFCLDKLNYASVNGEQITSDVDKFINVLPAVDAFEFVLNYSNLSLEMDSEGSGDAVKLMTIHKSKGIEFKVVFVVNTSNKFNFLSTRGSILFNKDYGVGMDFFDLVSRAQISTLPISAIRMIERRKLVEEQQRVFYVGLTRAIEKMYVICSKPIEKLSKTFPERQDCYANWLEPIISKELDGEHDENINFEKFDILDLFEIRENKDTQLLFSTKQVSPVNWFEYKDKNSTKINLKNSVSKLLKNEIFEKDEYENKIVFETDSSSADRGTIYHKVFQNIDFKNLSEIDNQLKNIKENFSENEQKIIDENLIKNVLNMPLFAEITQNNVIFKEREFYAKMPVSMIDKSANENDTFIMQGVIDLVVVKPEGLVILDYKTGSLDDEKFEKYKFQLNCYADVAQRAFGKKVLQKFLCMIDLQKILEI